MVKALADRQYLMERLKNDFSYHSPKTIQTAQDHEAMRDRCLGLAILLVDHCPPGRELDNALTKMEEVMFWANAAIARHQGVENETS